MGVVQEQEYFWTGARQEWVVFTETGQEFYFYYGPGLVQDRIFFCGMGQE